MRRDMGNQQQQELRRELQQCRRELAKSQASVAKLNEEAQLKLAALRDELSKQFEARMKESESDSQLIITMQQEQHAEE